MKDAPRTFPQVYRKAVKEAVGMTGGHVRKGLRKHIETGGRGWKSLSPITRAFKEGGSDSPLYRLGRMVRFKVTGRKGLFKLRIGFFPTRKLRKAERKKTGATYSVHSVKKQRQEFKAQFGMTHEALARKHEFGKVVRVTKKMRRMFAATGHPLKKSTKTINIPARGMIRPVAMTEKPRIGAYFNMRLKSQFYKLFYRALGRGKVK